MKRSMVFLALLMFFIAMPVIEAEEKVDAPVLKPGDTWTWSNGRTETFVKIEGDLLVFDAKYKNTVGTTTYYRTEELNLVREVVGEDVLKIRKPHNGWLNFPLYVGKRWIHFYNGRNKGESGSTDRRVDFQVTGMERIKTQAGEFACYKITGLDIALDKSFGIEAEIYYAPEIKNIVKITGRDGYNGLPIQNMNYELVDYSPPKEKP